MSGSYKGVNSEDRVILSGGRGSGKCRQSDDDEDDDGPCFCQFSESKQIVVTEEDSGEESFEVKEGSSPMKSIDHASMNERMNSTSTSEGTYRTPLLSPDLWDHEDVADIREDQQYDRSPTKQSEASVDRYSSKKSSIRRWSQSPRRSTADHDVLIEHADAIQEEDLRSARSEKSSKKQSEASADRYSSSKGSPEKRWSVSPRRSNADREDVVEDPDDILEDRQSTLSDKSPKKQSEASTDRYSAKKSSAKISSQSTRRSTIRNRDDVVEQQMDDEDVVGENPHTSYDHLATELLMSIVESHRDALNDQNIVLARQTDAINRLAAAVEEQTKIISMFNEKKIVHTLD